MKKTNRKITFINYMKYAGWLRAEIGSYLAKNSLSCREMERLSGVPYKTVLRFCRDLCATRYETFCALLKFLEDEVENGRHKFNSNYCRFTPLNYRNHLPILREKLMTIMADERLLPTHVSKKTGVDDETIGTFCKGKRVITFKTFKKIYGYVQLKQKA